MPKTLSIKSNYLAIGKDFSSFDSSRVVILPAPYEKTVSYGGGTRNGPKAILKASHYVEFYDEETRREIYKECGIATLSPLNFREKKDDQALSIIKKTIADLIAQDKFVVTLGGEHTISSAPVAAYLEKHPDLSVLQFDAHSDLRNEYQGNKYSHACVMMRICEMMKPSRITQVGIRAQCIEEAEFIRTANVNTFYAHDIRDGKYTRFLSMWDDAVVNSLSDHVYITFDVDAFDPSIMPATGTPEPNGLYWNEVLQCLRKVSKKKKIVGCDIVELAPMKGLSYPDLMVAKLISKILNYAL